MELQIHQKRRYQQGVGFLLALVWILLAKLETSPLALIPKGATGTDPISRFDSSLSRLRDSLPSRGTIGFVSDNTDPALYQLTQYALAPLVIERSNSGEVVIAFFSPRFAREGLRANRLKVFKDFGYGIYLARPL